MTQADDRILETLASSELILSPAVLAINTDYTRNYVNKRMKKLRESGLVERVDEGYYRITQRGISYLEGELDASDLEKD